MRTKLGRKCKKLGFRGRNDCLQILFRILFKWWALLIFFSAIGLLVFEASKLRTKQHARDSVVVPETNLNGLDPVTRMVNGIRQPCLKLLPPDALKHLDTPLGKETESPVRRVIYKSDDDASYLGGNTTLLQRSAEAGRFNSFTGSQTMSEREKSFEVNETVVVHCGFYSDNGGFKISDEDKNYMNTCKVVVSTCTFGGGDDLYQPIGMSDTSLVKVCYVAFWDGITLATQEESGKKIGADHMIGKWRIVIVKDLPFTDQRLNGKIPKGLKGCVCQICEAREHFADSCPYLYTNCKIKGCNGIRMLWESHTEANKGRKFLKCQHINCTGFEWLDNAIEESRRCIGSSSSNRYHQLQGCFHCGVSGHWKKECPWIASQCKKCHGVINLKVSAKRESEGRRYLKCDKCGLFEWFSPTDTSTSTGKVKMTLEASLDDLCSMFKNKMM